MEKRWPGDDERKRRMSCIEEWGQILKLSQQGAARVRGAKSAVYARLVVVGGGEALAWRRRAKASHVVHRGVGTDTQTESAGGGTSPRGDVCCLRSAGGCRRWRSVGLAMTSESVACRASRSGESGE